MPDDLDKLPEPVRAVVEAAEAWLAHPTNGSCRFALREALTALREWKPTPLPEGEKPWPLLDRVHPENSPRALLKEMQRLSTMAYEGRKALEDRITRLEQVQRSHGNSIHAHDALEPAPSPTPLHEDDAAVEAAAIAARETAIAARETLRNNWRAQARAALNAAEEAKGGG